MVIKILEITFPVILIVLIGLFYAKKTNISTDTINKVNLDIFIPILIFYSWARNYRLCFQICICL